MLDHCDQQLGKDVHSHHSCLTQYQEFLPVNKARKRNNKYRDQKGRNKRSLFVKDMIKYAEISKEYTKNF